MTDPAHLAKALTDWYEVHRRSLPWRCDRPDPYRVWVSEIMLQQTRVEAVIPYYERFLDAFPDPYALAVAEEARLLKLWEGLGYYSRARNLQKAAQVLVDAYGGRLPEDPALLRKLPGIGDYTAGAIASIAYGLPEPAVDGNVLRVLARLTADTGDIAAPAVKTRLTALARTLAEAADAPGTLNQSLMDLGAGVCIPAGPPRCESCPWREDCEARAQSIQGMLPVKAPKKPRKLLDYTPLLLLCGHTVALERRREGVLKGLWQFPMAEGHFTVAEAEDWLHAHGAAWTAVTPCPPCKHIFTHLEWHMTPILVRLTAPVPGFDWTTPEQMELERPLPSAFRACRELVWQQF